MGYRTHICSFDAVSLKGVGSNYYKFRERVLEAGRFSVFEATENMRLANLYTRLCQDPEVTTDKETRGFPWTLVRWANRPARDA